VYQWNKQGALSVTELSLPFFQDLVANVTTGTYTKASPTYRTITRAVKTYADGFASVVQEYTPADGSLSEEFDRNTGVPRSAVHLTWSYASFLTAIARRNGDVPPSWGSSAALAVPSQCNSTTVTGIYVTPTPSPW
jgi:glucoamylase